MTSPIGARLKQLRLDRNIRQADAAAAAGIGRPHLSKVENGEDSPSVDVLMCLAAAYRVPLSEVLPPEHPLSRAELVMDGAKQPRGAELEQTGDASGVLRRWIIVHEPGKVPEKKRPMVQTAEGAEDMLVQLALCRPAGTSYTMAQLTWDHDLWVSDGAEDLAMAAAAAPRRFAKRVREIAARDAPWLKTTPERIKLVARGVMP